MSVGAAKVGMHLLPHGSPMLNALTAIGALMTLIDFTLSNARRFYPSMGNPLAVSERVNQQLTVISVHVNGFNENYYPLTIQDFI